MGMMTVRGLRVALVVGAAVGFAVWAGATPWPFGFVRWEFLDASSQIEHPTPHSGFRSATEGDLDNDGDLDVVVVQNLTSEGVVGDPAPSVLYMNEDGRFVDRTAELLPELLAPQVTWWSNIHDFDSPPDGWADIFVPGGEGERSRLYRNRGRDLQGNFLGFVDESSRIDGPLAQSTFSYHSHKADFDGDGAMDMFVYQYRTDVSPAAGQNRLLMNRNGILMDETVERLPLRPEPGVFGHCEDLNGDGWVDISQVNLKNGLVPGVPASVPSIRVLINDGTGHFPVSLEQPMPERGNPQSSFGTYSLEHADLNGDGYLDIYVINWDENRDAVFVNSRDQSRLFPQANIYFPEFSNPQRDSDGDHPLSRDLNGDGRLDVVVAQFATRPYVLMNETSGGRIKLVERTPPEVPTGSSGFRTKLFDANGDGTFDIWLALRARNFLNVTLKPEVEPNDSAAGANPIQTYPALRTGMLGGLRAGAREGGGSELTRDRDFFVLPERAIAEGARVRLRPAADSDLMLTVRDAAGLVVAISQLAGNGSLETIMLPVGTAGRIVHVDWQGGQGSGTYRLEVTPTTGLQVAPEKVIPSDLRTKAASSAGDACHPRRQPPPRVSYSNP